MKKIDVSQRNFQGDNGRDEFQRETVATKVISLLASSADVSPMVIDGDWGTGKTEFCHKLINKFRAEYSGHRALYIDAFRADHADNPLMTILAEVLKLLPDATQRKNFIQKALPVIRYSLKTGLKIGIGHLLRKNVDDISVEIKDAIEDAAENAINASIEALLKDHEQAEESLFALQTTLATIAAKKPIVMFIDELDRCRPDFAVQMLEVIKHTFDVENVKFVLVTNTTQLKAAINHCYGGVDSHRYLDKFVKFRFSLPDIHGDLYISQSVSISHAINLLRQSDTLKDSILFDRSKPIIREFLLRIVKSNNLSLRESEKLINYLEIYHVISKDNSWLHKNSETGKSLSAIVGIYLYYQKSHLAKEIAESGFIDVEGIADAVGIKNAIHSLINEPTRIEPDLTIKTLLYIWAECNPEKFLSSARSDINTLRTYWKRDIDNLFSWPSDLERNEERIMLLKIPILTLMMKADR